MSTISLKEAKASFSHILDQAAAGEFVTITRHGRPAAVIVSVGAAEKARKAIGKPGRASSNISRPFRLTPIRMTMFSRETRHPAVKPIYERISPGYQHDIPAL